MSDPTQVDPAAQPKAPEAPKARQAQQPADPPPSDSAEAAPAVADVAPEDTRVLVKFVGGDWTVDAVSFRDDQGDVHTVTRAGVYVDSAERADELIAAAAESGFVLAKPEEAAE